MLLLTPNRERARKRIALGFYMHVDAVYASLAERTAEVNVPKPFGVESVIEFSLDGSNAMAALVVDVDGSILVGIPRPRSTWNRRCAAIRVHKDIVT